MIIKNLSVLILMFLLSCNLLNAQELESLMQTGNDFYQNKQFEDAIGSYESILKQGYFSSDLYYNLGNSYYRTGNIGKSILYLEKSLKVSPNNDDAIHNLKIVNARTVDKIQEIPPLFFFKWWNVLLSTFTSTGWQVIIFVIYILLLFCIAFYSLIRNLQVQKLSFIFGSFSMVALIVSVILFFSSLSREASDDYGILLQSVTTAKISPDTQSNDAFVVHEGIKFQIEDKVNKWVKIKLADGKVGWLPSNSFEVI
jgi:tetratricopeptide (TPR) repeat protein